MCLLSLVWSWLSPWFLFLHSNRSTDILKGHDTCHSAWVTPTNPGAQKALLTVVLGWPSHPRQLPRAVSFQPEEWLGYMYILDLSIPQLQTAEDLEEFMRRHGNLYQLSEMGTLLIAQGFFPPSLTYFFEVKSSCCQRWWGLACLTEVVIWQDVSSLSFKLWNRALSICWVHSLCHLHLLFVKFCLPLGYTPP